MYKGNDKKQFIRVPKMLKQNIRKHDEHMGAKELFPNLNVLMDKLKIKVSQSSKDIEYKKMG